MARRLRSVAVHGLLGRFDHELEFPEGWEFLILHGPNGVGKTRLLEIVANTFSFRTQRLRELPFEEASFTFSDNTALRVLKTGQTSLPLESEAEQDLSGLQYRLYGPTGTSVSWNPQRRPSISSRVVRELERYLPVEQVGADLWVDQRTGEPLTLAEVTERYSDELPFGFEVEEVPVALQEFVSQFDVHLIETQRLLTFGSKMPPSRTRRPSQRATVLQFADDLTRRIREALALNSRTSQELDRTFPRRVLTTSIPPEVTDEQIRQRYQLQSELRDSLAGIAVLDPSGEMPLPEKTLQPWERRVLWTYLEDSDRKLATFQTLLDRVQLLREIVNSRFLFKDLVIDPEAGFRFVMDTGADLGASQLSSGEQHELVLLYDLLFNVRPNSLVLVDEPEISLHIAWQQQFLNDIQRIAALADLRFVIATHSPQIIHTWWDRAVSLYREPRQSAAGDSETARKPGIVDA